MARYALGGNVQRMSEHAATDVEPDRHWDEVYRHRGDDGVSWFQPAATTSLTQIDVLNLAPDAAVLDVGGGASRLVDGLLARGYTDVSVLDVSLAALEVARDRVGAAAPVSWIRADLFDWRPPRRFDLWHDRAMFHFLTSAADRARYLAVLASALRPGGAVVMATFAPEGPQTCSWLPVTRYSPEELAAVLGDGFQLCRAEREEHVTPSGVVQAFSWVAGPFES